MTVAITKSNDAEGPSEGTPRIPSMEVSEVFKQQGINLPQDNSAANVEHKGKFNEPKNDDEATEMKPAERGSNGIHNGATNGSVEGGKSKNGSMKRKLGRRGDPRMHRAVAARLKNPQMSLLDALLEGGFEFPNISDEKDKSGGFNGQIADKDNVQLCQRKNQLSRRLRLARQGNQNQGNESKLQSEKQDDDDVLSIEDNSAINRKHKKPRQLSFSNKDQGSSQKRRSSYSVSDREESGTEDTKRRSSLLSLQNQSGLNSFGSGFHQSFSNKLHNPYLNASSGDLLSSLKASSLPTSLALQQQQLLLQRQAALQDASSLSNLSNHGNQYSHSSGANINDINGNSDSLFLNSSSALSDIEQALRHQQEMARIMATAKIFANSARKVPLSTRESFTGSAHLRHSLTGGVLQGDLMDSSHIDDDTWDDEKNDSRRRNSRSSHSSSSAALAHAYHLNQSKPGSSILRSSLTAGSSNISSNSASNKKLTPLDQTKLKMALDVFRAENASLMKRCLLLAGFEGPQTEESSPVYLELLSKVIKAEEQRYSNLCKFNDVMDGPSNENPRKNSLTSTGSSSPRSDEEHASNSNSPEKVDTNGGENHGRRFEREHGSSRRRSSRAKSVLKNKIADLHNRHSTCVKSDHRNSSRNKLKNVCFKGRHIHRMGKCGHKAIIHKPKDAPAHVDFVINGKVECYQHVKKRPSSKDGTALWPSKFNSDELGFTDDEYANELINCGDSNCDNECANIDSPILLENVDFNDDEWNDNFINGDDVLGLMEMDE